MTPFPVDFRSSQVVNADATINVRVGGHGPAVVLIHGFGDAGDMWYLRQARRDAFRVRPVPRDRPEGRG